MTGLELLSKITASGQLEVWLHEVTVPKPAADEVVVRVEATPLNPSDIGLLFGAADLSTLQSGGTPERPTLSATVPAARMPAMAGRVDQALPVGNEGAGTVVDAGSDARELAGHLVATRTPGMYAQYRVAKLADCIVLPNGTPPAAGASAFVNPLTALGMVETLRREGHRGIVHTAAASNLGQMLVRLCRADSIPLVNVVRSPQQVALLRELGATHVVDSTSDTFVDELTEAIEQTGATLAFDAIGGGTLGDTILAAIERVASRNATVYSRYGSSVHKQLYIYGGLDTSPTILNRSYGMAWGIGGWLVFSYLQKLGPEGFARLRDRVAAELTTTFASTYSAEITLAETLAPATVAAYTKRATGEKYLITPNR
jgi:NADPH:quinone reductase-like Zn-dependent oxidoreductase